MIKNKADISKLLNILQEKQAKKLVLTGGKPIHNNFLISGDSEEVLVSLILNQQLQDIIMIDPPYNENKSAGKYQDIWKGAGKNFSWAGEKHGAYLDFLNPKIRLGKELLTEIGLMMVFIGDSEYPYLRVLMNMVFGESNYIGTVIWESSSNQQKNKLIDRNHEYVMIYAKNIKSFSKLGLYKINTESYNHKLFEYAQELKNNGLSWSENQVKYLEYFSKIKKEHTLKSKTGDAGYLSNLKYILPNAYVPFTLSDPGAPDSRNRPKTRLTHPTTKELCGIPRGGKGWALAQEYLDRIQNSKNVYHLHDGKILVQEDHDASEDIKGIVFGEDETTMPCSCRIFSERTDKKVMQTTGWVYKGDKKQGIDPIVGFETVKPMEFLSELLSYFPNNNTKVLDFFAGSGTLAVATHLANQIDKGLRNWTLVELNSTTIEKVLKPKLKHFNIQDYQENKLDLEDNLLKKIETLNDEQIQSLIDILLLAHN